jgi:desulfoferrodoxin (superoxide reductase-like protein)
MRMEAEAVVMDEKKSMQVEVGVVAAKVKMVAVKMTQEHLVSWIMAFVIPSFQGSYTSLFLFFLDVYAWC